MSPLATILAEVAAAAKVDDQDENPEAHAALLHSIQRLQLAAEKPIETAKRIIYQPPTNAALRIAVELGLIDAVAAHVDDPITAHRLAIERNFDELLVIRVMRAITAMGVCTEAGAGLYSPNRVTREFARVGLRDGVKCLYDTFMPAAASVVKCLYHIEMEAPREASKTPFFFAMGATMFEWMKENPQQREFFDSYMGFRRIEISPWYQVFLINDQFTTGIRSDPRAVLIVDVGGSHGHDLLKFKEQYPDLPGRLILQDLPETINSLTGELSGIEPMAYNFYAPQPIKGARVYYFGAMYVFSESTFPPLSLIMSPEICLGSSHSSDVFQILMYRKTDSEITISCHNWSDDACVKFLSNTATAMEKDYSILLINDYVVPETGASVHTAAMDIQMMSLVAGIERTQSQWMNLLGLSGLTLMKVWHSRNGLESIIEATIHP